MISRTSGTTRAYAIQKQEMQNYGVELTVSPENPNLVPAGSNGSRSRFATIIYPPPPTPSLPILLSRLPSWRGAASSRNWSNSANWNPATPSNAPPNAVAPWPSSATRPELDGDG